MTDLPPIDFILTPQERRRAAMAAAQIEAHRRRQNERDAMLGLARWRDLLNDARERAQGLRPQYRTPVTTTTEARAL